MKHLLMVASMAIVLIGAAACTRERPPVTMPTPADVAFQQGTVTPPPDTSVIPPTLATDFTPTAESTSAATATSVLPTTLLETPAAIPTSGATTAPATGQTTYTVQLGDWLSKIAQRFGVTSQAIVAANPGMDPNHIIPGQVINIPSSANMQGPTATPGTGIGMSGPTTYTVQRGDWFYAIARKFGVSVAALQAANPGVSSGVVYPGQVLNIPASSTAPNSSTPSSSTPSSATAIAPAPKAESQSASQTQTPNQTYTVRPGDTLYSIAVRFHTTPYALQLANHLANSNFVYTGQQLIIP